MIQGSFRVRLNLFTFFSAMRFLSLSQIISPVSPGFYNWTVQTVEKAWVSGQAH